MRSQRDKFIPAGGSFQWDRSTRECDAGKKTKNCNRHALVDTDGHDLVLEPSPVSIEDRDFGATLLRGLRGMFPFIQQVFALSGYAGEEFAKGTFIAVYTVRRNTYQAGFAVNPWACVVERFIAWIDRNRSLARDFEVNDAAEHTFPYAALSCSSCRTSPHLHTIRPPNFCILIKAI